MRNFLLCVDDSECAMSASKYAINLAKMANAHVDIVYVSDLKKFEMSALADFGGSIGVQPFQGALSATTNLENEKAAVLEKKFSKIFVDAGLEGRFKFTYKTGLIADIFTEFKNGPTGLDFVILGKTGESSDPKGKHVGKTVEAVLHNDDCPCLIVPKKFSPIKKILVAYDGSETSTKALHFIGRNLFLKDCEFHVLSVRPDQELKRDIKTAEEVLSNIAGLNVTFVQKKSEDVVETLTKYVKEKGIDLLMTGSFSHNIIRQLLFGSTTIDILEALDSAIMVFR